MVKCVVVLRALIYITRFCFKFYHIIAAVIQILVLAVFHGATKSLFICQSFTYVHLSKFILFAKSYPQILLNFKVSGLYTSSLCPVLSIGNANVISLVQLTLLVRNIC